MDPNAARVLNVYKSALDLWSEIDVNMKDDKGNTLRSYADLTNTLYNLHHNAVSKPESGAMLLTAKWKLSKGDNIDNMPSSSHGQLLEILRANSFSIWIDLITTADSNKVEDAKNTALVYFALFQNELIHAKDNTTDRKI